MRYRLQRHDGTDCSATMVPITVLRMVPIQRYRHLEKGLVHKNNIYNHPIKYIYQTLIIKQVPRNLHNIFNLTAIMHH